MKIDEIDFPAPLLSALRDGSLVVFAGAGVSMGKPASLPDFGSLVKTIAQGTGKNKLDREAEDVFLGRLHHRDVRVHEIAARNLHKNLCGDTPKPTGLHRDLLRLYPEQEAVRIVTTNFDLLFEDAAQEIFPARPELFRAPALPLGRSFSGIVHVHGSLDRPDDMVLTDADFGRAYLTEGWARRFLVELFRSFTVMFVGYGHNDPVMKYLARALPAQESQKRFALTEDPDADHWPVLGIEPVPYPRKPGDDHVGLGKGIHGLANHARRGLLDRRHEISEIAERPPSPDESEADIVDEALSDSTTAQFFADAATDPEWLHRLDRRGHLAPLFGAADLPDLHGPLAGWMVGRFVFDHSETVFQLIGRHGMCLNPMVWHQLANAVAFRDHPALNGDLLSRWVSCLLATAQPHSDRHVLLYLAQRCARAGLEEALIETFDAMSAHRLYLRPALPDFDEELTGDAGLSGNDIEVELVPDEDGGAFRELWETDLRPRLDSVAEPILAIAVTHLDARHRTLSGWQKADRDWDPESFSRHAIEPHEQNHNFHHVDVLVDAARDCLEWLIGNRPEAAAAWCARLVRSRTPLLRRLSVHALSAGNDLSTRQKLDWVFKNADLHDDAAHHEMFRIMRELYPQSGPEQRERVIDLIRDFTWPDDEEEQRKRLASRHRFEWLHWLHDADPDCELVKQALDEIQSQYPEFAPLDHPDLTHWSHNRTGPNHPWSTDELVARPAGHWLDNLLSFSPESPLGPNRHDAISAVAAAAERNFRWGVDLAAALADLDLWESDLWIALLRAWREPGLAEIQLHEVFGYIHNPRLSKVFTGRIADLLVAWIERTDAPITGELLGHANEIAARLWDVIDREAAPEPCDSWHALAIGRPAGALARYWLRQRSLLRDRPDLLLDNLLTSVGAALSVIARDSSIAGLLGRSVLAGQLAYLLETEEEWTREQLVHRFTQQPGTGDWQAVWDGFLAHGRLTPLVGECLKDAFLEAVSLVPTRFRNGWRLDRFVDFLTLMLAHFADDPVGTWIPVFFDHADGAARYRFASEIGRHLRQMDDAHQREWWERWLGSYWSRRVDGIPRALDETEIGLMIGWLPALKSLFSDGVELALCTRSVPMPTNRTIHDLLRGDHVGDSPEAVAKLMIHLGKHASPGPAWYRGREVIAALLGNEHLPTDLRKPLLELAARLGPA
ncbi:MAG: DUF4020 domain-containing protein [Rhodospirillaceae bacterium]|nr:DUF4020 domain-containing protein [Rhodospirillaceae bacterium]